MPRHLTSLRAALILAASILFAIDPVVQWSYAATQPANQPTTPPTSQLAHQPTSPPTNQPSRGQAIYDQRCASCHGPSGEGDGPMAEQIEFPLPDFTDAATMRTRSPDQLFQVITKGNMQRLMPPWENALSEAERWDVLFYVMSLATTQEAIEQGSETYSTYCADCHGEQGGGDGPQAATLPSPPPDFTNLTQMASKSQANLFATVSSGEGHALLGSQLGEEERWAVLDFVRTFAYQTRDATAEATEEGIIAVQIVNGTADADPSGLANLEVTLHRFFADESLGTVTGSSDSEGHVRFTDLPTGPDYGFGVTVRYQDIEYGSNLVDFPQGATSLPLTVNVYDTTDSDSAIRVFRTHLIFDFVGQGFRVAEMHIIGNEGDRTYIGSTDGGTLEFTLPEGALGLTFEDSQLQNSVIKTEDGFIDTLPVPPGGRQILLSYSVAVEAGTYRFARHVSYPTDNLNVLVSDVGATVNSEFLTEQEPIAAGEGQRYLHLAGQDLAPDTEFVITFDELPSTVPSSSAREAPAVPRRGLDMNLLRWLGTLLAAVGVSVAALGYPMLRQRWESDPAQQVGALEREQEALIQAIARLDDRFEGGEISEGEYQHRRARQKERLTQVARRLRGWDV